MNFYFDSLENFIHMNGHGIYVWFCYVVTFVVLASLVVYPSWSKRQFILKQKNNLRRDKALAAKKANKENTEQSSNSHIS